MFEIEITKSVNHFQLVQELRDGPGIDVLRNISQKGNKIRFAGVSAEDEPAIQAAYDAHIFDSNFDHMQLHLESMRPPVNLGAT